MIQINMMTTKMYVMTQFDFNEILLSGSTIDTSDCNSAVKAVL